MHLTRRWTLNRTPYDPDLRRLRSDALATRARVASTPALRRDPVAAARATYWATVRYSTEDRTPAADAWCAPVLMRKGRPGHVLSALAGADVLDAVCQAMFRQTTTLGVRVSPVQRRSLHRDQIAVSVGQFHIDLAKRSIITLVCRVVSDEVLRAQLFRDLGEAATTADRDAARILLRRDHPV